MSDDRRPGATRQDLPDEMPRSAISEKAAARREARGDGYRLPTLVWALFALLVAAGFIALLWMLSPRA